MRSNSSGLVVSSGLSLGSALGAIISFHMNGLVGWAILHAWAGWIYVIYALVVGYVKF